MTRSVRRRIPLGVYVAVVLAALVAIGIVLFLASGNSGSSNGKTTSMAPMVAAQLSLPLTALLG